MFDMAGLSEFAAQIQDLYGSVEEISQDLLNAGAPKVEQLWKQELDRNTMKNGTELYYGRQLRSGHIQRVKYFSRSYGDMKGNVNHDTKTTLTDIYPHGVDRKKNQSETQPRHLL